MGKDKKPPEGEPKSQLAEMLELGHQIKALSEMLITTAKQMQSEEEIPRDPE